MEVLQSLSAKAEKTGKRVSKRKGKRVGRAISAKDVE
jgi:tetrahydromethanopterin S-methyltransferase subunit G